MEFELATDCMSSGNSICDHDDPLIQLVTLQYIFILPFIVIISGVNKIQKHTIFHEASIIYSMIISLPCV